MDRHRTPCFTGCSTVRSHRAPSLHILLCSKTLASARSDLTAARRQALHRETLARLQNDCCKTEKDGAPDQSKASARAHGRAWIGWVSTRSQYLQATSGTPEVSLPLKRPGNHAADASLEHRHHVHPVARRLCLPHSSDRLAQPAGACPSPFEQPRQQLLHRSLRRGNRSVREAGELQYRSGGAVFFGGICQCSAEQKYSVQHGWQRSSPRQHLRGTAMEVCKI